MVFCIGLTGSIASGKTTAARILSDLGAEVIQADEISRALTAQNMPAFQEIIHHFGEAFVLENGSLDRRKLRDRIFTHSEDRKWLEQLLHPLIRKEIQKRAAACASTYCLIEIPLLTDKQNYPYLDRILLIDAPEEVQVSRIMQRDNCSKQDAIAILSAQPDMNQRLSHADDVIINDQDLNALTEAVKALHRQYINASG